jgi:hypothetical protein
MHNGVYRIDEIFWETAQLAPGAERERYLARVCGADQALRQRVEHLLKVQPKVEGFHQERRILFTSTRHLTLTRSAVFVHRTEG